MKYTLDPTEIRILGALIEKQLSTPEYYPLTLNALVNACNQKSNRHPVMNLDEISVIQALDSLKKQHLVWQIMTHGSRTAKYEHNLKEVAGFSDYELALLCELLLRGPQTIGELRTRASRMAEFYGLSDVENTLQKLVAHESGPFAAQLPRAPGHKENRYAHLFCEAQDIQRADAAIGTDLQEPAINDLYGRMADLEKKVAELEKALDDLRKEFLETKGQR